MKWFKHFSSLHRQPECQAIIRKLGFEWYGRYLVVLSECAEQYNGDKSSTTFTLHVDQLKTTLRVVGDQWTTTLRLVGDYSGFTFKVLGEFIILEVPIIAELFHKDSTSSKVRRAKLGTLAGRDKEEEEDKEEDLDKELPKREKAQKKGELSEHQKTLNSKTWDAYRQEYLNRYHVEPIRNASVNSKISQLAQRLGADAPEVVRFFVAHPDSFYVKNMHAIGLCLKDAESLSTQWRKGKAITSNDMRNYERNQGYQQIIDDINAGKV